MSRNYWSFMPRKGKAKRAYTCAACGKAIPHGAVYVNWPTEGRYHVACFERENPDMVATQPLQRPESATARLLRELDGKPPAALGR